jgi:signal peptidase II
MCATPRRLLHFFRAHLDSCGRFGRRIPRHRGRAGKKAGAPPFGAVSLSLVLAGAVGNLIDRVALGYVTDMFKLLFIQFAVFNVADVCVVVGGISTCVYLIFFTKKLEKSALTEQINDQSDDSDG